MIRHGTFALVILAAVFDQPRAWADALQATPRRRRRHPRCASSSEGDREPHARRPVAGRDAALSIDRGRGPTRAAAGRAADQPQGRLLATHHSPTPGSPSSRSTVLPRRRIEIPEGASIQGPTWSHDGKRIAFARDLEDGVELWIADAATGRAKPIAGARLNDVLADEITWQSDNRHLLAVLVPEGRGPAPQAPRRLLAPTCK